MTDSNSPPSHLPGGRKPYSPPRLMTCGHVKDIVQGSSGNKNDPGTTKNCWVAEAIYGTADPRTLLLRGWLTAVHAERRAGWRWVEMYRTVGPVVAGWIVAGRLPRWTLRPLFDRLAEKAFSVWARTIRDARDYRPV